MSDTPMPIVTLQLWWKDDCLYAGPLYLGKVDVYGEWVPSDEDDLAGEGGCEWYLDSWALEDTEKTGFKTTEAGGRAALLAVALKVLGEGADG